MEVDLVLEGGGVKGIALVGALGVLEREGFRVHDVAGASAGAVVGALHAAGYTAEELRGIVGRLDLRAFGDAGWGRRLPAVGAPLAILRRQGFHRGRAFRTWISELLEARRVRTFADLARPGGGDAHRLQVIVSDLTNRELLALPRDAGRLGLDPDAVEVALAVRASIGVPFVFEPVRVRNRETGREHVLVDGGVLSNFPVWLFDCDDEPARPTFGLLLVESDPRAPLVPAAPEPARARGVRAAFDLGRDLLQTMLEARDRRYLETADFVRTIRIPTGSTGTFDFELTSERVEALLAAGAEAAEQFLAGWDFRAYTEGFRR